MIVQYIFITFIPFYVSGAPSPLIELSYSFDENTPNWPLATKFSTEVSTNGTEPYGVWIIQRAFCSSEHTGTHMDAPYHFIKGAISVDLIAFENLYRVAGVKVDVTEKAKYDRDYKITAQDMDDWVGQNGPLPDGVVVLFETGWGLKAHDPQEYSGMDDESGHSLHFPGVGTDAAQWLVDYGAKNGQERGVVGIGSDTMSMDAGDNTLFEVHVILLGANIFGLENVKNIHMLPTRGFTLTMMPMKIRDGSGGPTRILAEIDGVPFTH